MARPACHLLGAVLLVASCGGPDRSKSYPPPEFDVTLSKGRRLDLPVAGEFPRIGLQWTYGVESGGLGSFDVVPARIAYRLVGRDGFGHPWAGYWLYEGPHMGMEGTGATIEPRDVYFHPPRAEAFRALQVAPWPVARPGVVGERSSELAIGEGWGSLAGTKIRKTMTDVGRESVEVPAGRFDGAWRVDGKSPGWTGSFWWADRVGFVRMVFRETEGKKRLDLRLLDVRQVEAETK